jgi:hypothetical protein
MSWTQETFSCRDNSCQRADESCLEPCRGYKERRFNERDRKDDLGDSDRRQPRCGSILRPFPNSFQRADGGSVEKEPRCKSPRATRSNTSRPPRRSDIRIMRPDRTECASPKHSGKDGECRAAQVELFQERGDLRKCLLPGMVSRISPEACEGWQRRVWGRSSRILAKIKLEPCTRCYYGQGFGLQPGPTAA